jgi:hypothetical protein
MTIVYILIALAVVIVALVIVIAMQPADFRVVRSAKISGPPSETFAQVNDFHKWEAWSPWAKLDPAMKVNYEGPPAGTGASYSWNGNRNVGAGRMTITESRPSDLVRIKLDFLRPFASTNAVDFTFNPEGDRTVVTWTMVGKKIFMTKAFGLVMSMDKMVGGMFDQGLSQMKAVVEAKKVAVS